MTELGSQDEKVQTCDAVYFGVELPDGTDMKLSAYSVPLICEPFTGQSVAPVRNMYKHLNEIHLDDYSKGAEAAEGDILIGSDQSGKRDRGSKKRRKWSNSFTYKDGLGFIWTNRELNA